MSRRTRAAAVSDDDLDVPDLDPAHDTPTDLDPPAADTPRRAGVGRGRRLDPKRVVIVALVLSVVALTLAVPVRTFFSQQSEVDQVQRSNAALRQQVAQLQQKVDEQQDPATIRRLARERLGYVDPGDNALVMIYPSAPPKSDAQKRADQRAGDPWYSKLLGSVTTPPGG
ncbi:septum formation initiator family protein [Williamsia sp. CHRR-6]|uniref:FtsB family cell division protein n=1 Tax=Williamsia sp. CHRR-6 TaxID=2835871 RepID=UPI0027DB8EDC|nr:septum formation initiator family protein [Williamsia sp. CHRR-6]